MKNSYSLAVKIALTYLIVAAQCAQAGPIASYFGTIGVTVPNTSTEGSGGGAWTPSNSSVKYAIEDSSAGTFVGPGYGGQPYDLEALYVQTIGAQLLITGVSGANLTAMPSGTSGTCASGSACYTFPIGDFFLGTGNTQNVYNSTSPSPSFTPFIGVEVTGQHYTMSSSGYTTGWDSPLLAGSVVNVDGTNTTSGGFERGLSNWSYVGSPSQLASSGFTGNSSTRRATVTSEMINGHSAFQASINISDLFIGTSSTFISSLMSGNYIVHWGELCGNDYIRAAGTAVPEPSTLSLIGIGLIGMLILRAYRRAKIANLMQRPAA